MSLPVSKDDLTHCRSLVQQHVPDHFLAHLLLDEETRMIADIVWAFHVEITQIPLLVSEPMVGEIRLQWWAEILAGQRSDEANGHPVARAMLVLIDQFSMATGGLEAKLKAHIFDLYQDPMESRTMLEGWSGETRSSLFQTIALARWEDEAKNLSDLCGHVGVALSIVGILQNLSLHRSKGQTYIPTEYLAKAGVSSGALRTGDSANIQSVIDQMLALADDHYKHAMTCLAVSEVDKRALFLPLSVVPVYLEKQRLAGIKLLDCPASVLQLRRQWTLWRASRSSEFTTIN